MKNEVFEIKHQNKANVYDYLYVLIIVIAIGIFRWTNVDTSSLFGLMVGLIIVYVLMNNTNEDKNFISDQKKIKKDSIKPQSAIIGEHDEFVDFLFSIQDMYGFCPKNYEELVDNIENFLTVYNDTIKIQTKAGKNYFIATSCCKNALNALHSILYSTDVAKNKFYSGKINRACEKLTELFREKIAKIATIHEMNIIDTGYDINTCIIPKFDDPKENNYFEQESEGYTYDIY